MTARKQCGSAYCGSAATALASCSLRRRRPLPRAARRWRRPRRRTAGTRSRSAPRGAPAAPRGPARTGSCARAGSTPSSARAWASRTATSSGPPDAAGDLVAAEALPGRAGDEPPGAERRRATRRAAMASRRDQRAGRPGGQRRLAVLDLAQHVGGPLGVAVAQRLVVGAVDVAGGQLGVEVAQRPQQEPPLVLELGEPVGVHRGRARPPARRPRCASAAATSARSSSVGSCVGGGLAAPAAERHGEAGDGADERGDRQRPHQGVEAGRLRARAGRWPPKRDSIDADDLVVARARPRRRASGSALRMFSDAVLRDSKTLSPSHTGQAMRCSMRLGPLGRACSARRRGSPRRRGTRRRRARAAPTPASASAAAVHRRTARAAAAAGRRGSRRVTRRDDPAADDAVGVDDPRLGHLGHAEGDGDRAVVVVARPASRRPRRRRTPRRSSRSSS